MTDNKSIDIRLLVDKEKKRVVFVECDMDFVDVLFSFLTLPLGNIVRLSNKKSNLGCMDNLYQSVEALDTEYLETDSYKEMLLRPKNCAENECRNLVLNLEETSDGEIRYYKCPTWSWDTKTHCFMSMFKDAKCLCGEKMNEGFVLNRLKIAENDKPNGVFVKGIRKYLISDDLRVRAVSTDTSLSILVGFGIQDGTLLEERIVSVGIKEVLSLLSRSLVSTMPMTDVFLRDDMNMRMIKIEPLDIKLESDQSEKKKKKKMKLNLLIRKSSNKVIYGVAKADFLDFIFSSLAVPIGSAVKLLGGNLSLGSVDNLYKSVEMFCDNSPEMFEACKKCILDAKVACHHGCENQILQLEVQESYSVRMFEGFTCFGLDEGELKLINPKYLNAVTENGKGFIKESGMFMITDDLIVEPLSPISTISFVNKLGIPLSDLEERSVSVGEQQAQSILKALLTSENVFTSVFCGKT